MRGSSIRLRLQRFGAPKKPFYRIVACARDAPRDGKFLEILGNYNPIPDINGNKTVNLKVDSIKKWITRGAEPSERVAKLLGLGEILPPVPRRALLRDHSLLMELPAAAEDGDAVEEDDDLSSEEADASGDAADADAGMNVGDGGEGAEQPRT